MYVTAGVDDADQVADGAETRVVLIVAASSSDRQLGQGPVVDADAVLAAPLDLVQRDVCDAPELLHVLRAARVAGDARAYRHRGCQPRLGQACAERLDRVDRDGLAAGDDEGELIATSL